MNTKNHQLSDSEILAKFKSCSPKIGKRLALYAELKGRNLLNALASESQLLFRGITPVGGAPENLYIIAGCVIVGTIIRTQFERSLLAVAIVYLAILLPLFSLLNLIFYRVIFIYPDKVSVATCLFSDKIRLKCKTVRFGVHGLYINAYYRQLSTTVSPLFPKTGLLNLRAVPNVDPCLRCELSLKTINDLLAQLRIFFESIEQDVFIESSSTEIPLLKLITLTNLKSFCLRQAESINKADMTTADVNWLRLIATVSNSSIPEEIQNRPLSKPLTWLESDEHPVLCLNTYLKGFRNKGYLWLTNCRVVWSTLSGGYVNGTTYNDKILKPYYPHQDSGVWLIEFETTQSVQRANCPYPLSSIFTYFTNRRLCK